MRRLATLALSYCAAVFVAQYLLPRQFWLPAGVLCAFFTLLSFCFRDDRRLRILLLALGLAAGFLWCRAYDAIFYTAAEELDGHTVAVSATVNDWPRETDYGTAILIRMHTDGHPDTKAVLYADESSAALRPGDRISVIAACRLAEHTKSGNESTYYTSKGIFLSATAYGEIITQAQERIPPRYWPQLAGKVIKESVSANFPEGTVPFMTALITGDLTGMDDALSAALRRTGLSHVVAVSGMHVSFLAGLLLVLLGKRRRRLTAAVSIVLIFFFASLAGNTPSVLRAAFQCALLQAAPLFKRENDTPTALSAVLAMLLMQNPRAAANIGLQLSFAAVAGIYLLAPRFYDRWTKRLPEGKLPAKAVRFLVGALATTLGAIVFTTPLTAYYFGTVSLISPLSNLLALWAVSAAFTAGLAAALIGLIVPPLGSAAAFAAALPVWYLQGIIPALCKIPYAAVKLNSIYYNLWLLFSYAAVCMFLLWRGGNKRPFLPVCASAVVLCAAVLFTRTMLVTGELAVSVLDVGQGQSVAFHAGSYTALVDCGGSGTDNAGDVAADYLQNLGCSQLDLLVLTHYHADHADGVEELMERLEVKAVALPDAALDDAARNSIVSLAEREGAEIRYVSERDEITLGEAIFTLYPSLGGEDDNERGLAVLGSAGDYDVLITGDMDGDIEARLVKYNRLPDIELLIAGHHGSKYSTSEKLLSAVTPELAVISVGKNTYGHPSAETLARLEEDNIAVYRTDLQGTVTVAVH